jgi:tripartite-type tricarboxylate transporter receptor subunit TctC
MRKLSTKLAVSALLLAFAPVAHAEWPEKPINFVIAFEPGGGADQSALPLKPLLEKSLGQNLLFNYKPGAGGRIGFEIVAMNGGDGHTIGMLTEPHFTNTTIFDKPRYKREDLTPIALFTRDVPIWFVRKDSPIKDMNDLIAEAKKRPGEVTVATGSFTGEQYLTLAILEEQTGIKFRAVNVKGGGAVITNVLGGHFDVGIIRPASVSGVKSEITALGVVADKRSDIFPDTKTFDEQLPDDIKIPHFSSSRGVMVATKFAEANPAAVKKLEAALHDAVLSPEYQAAMERMGLPLEWVSSEQAKKELIQTAEGMQKYKELVNNAKNR